MRLTQRRKVLLPEPLAPMIEITSPARTSSDTLFSTSLASKRLRMSFSFRSGASAEVAVTEIS
jgi:hypothetical protein